jgi:hypothetical protein
MNNDQDTLTGAGTSVSVGHEIIPSAAAIEAVRAAVAGWEGVTTDEHRFGGIAFRVGRRELGHLHGSIADLPFPRPVRDELVAAGRARPHHVVPDSGGSRSRCGPPPRCETSSSCFDRTTRERRAFDENSTPITIEGWSVGNLDNLP